MKKFVESYPEFRKMAGNVSKHVALMSELSRIMDGRSLMDVSELEQELACNHSPAEAFSKVISDPCIPHITNTRTYNRLGDEYGG